MSIMPKCQAAFASACVRVCSSPGEEREKATARFLAVRYELLGCPTWRWSRSPGSRFLFTRSRCRRLFRVIHVHLILWLTRAIA
jgi:hypothetical protein